MNNKTLQLTSNGSKPIILLPELFVFSCKESFTMKPYNK